MGKRRISRMSGGSADSGKRSRALAKIPKTRAEKVQLHIEATFNNTRLTLTDNKGGALMWSSAGSLGFAGARKGTPFAAAKVGEVIGEKAMVIGVKEAEIFIKGVGPGRESALRAFAGKGIQLSGIHDVTPIPHNGPRQPKPRRV